MGASERQGAGVLTFQAVTTFAERHWESHARRCVESFGEHWQGIRLLTYTDEQLEAYSDWLSQFKRRNAGREIANYRFDAVRFAHKVAALDLAYQSLRADVLVWIDADCVTHAPVDAAWLAGLLGDADFGYLRRANKYPECGFMLMRRGPAMDEMLGLLVDLYRTDALFGLLEWHDSWAIEHVRGGLGDKLRCASLSGEFEHTGHPFVNGPLGARMDHCKGKRKGGRSTASDLKTHRNEDYWRG
jgi:hypothetical protein